MIKEEHLEVGAIDQLKKIQKLPDHEEAHMQADVVLCVVLRKLGYDELVNEWLKTNRYYS